MDKSVQIADRMRIVGKTVFVYGIHDYLDAVTFGEEAVLCGLFADVSGRKGNNKDKKRAYDSTTINPADDQLTAETRALRLKEAAKEYFQKSTRTILSGNNLTAKEMMEIVYV